MECYFEPGNGKVSYRKSMGRVKSNVAHKHRVAPKKTKRLADQDGFADGRHVDYLSVLSTLPAPEVKRVMVDQGTMTDEVLDNCPLTQGAYSKERRELNEDSQGVEVGQKEMLGKVTHDDRDGFMAAEEFGDDEVFRSPEEESAGPKWMTVVHQDLSVTGRKIAWMQGQIFMRWMWKKRIKTQGLLIPNLFAYMICLRRRRKGQRWYGHKCRV